MNNQQAINLLKDLEQCLDDYCELNDEGKTAFGMAITALELFGNSEQLPSAQPEQIARDIATIIENEKDMRVILQNEHTETHSCVCNRTETHDLVSRQAVIDLVEELETQRLKGDIDLLYVPMIKGVRALPPAQPESRREWYMKGYRDAQRWIPVTERLPEDACQCIVTAKVKHVDNYPDYEVDTADFADGIFTTANSWWGVESIIAWMPLPEPWKGEQDGTT